MIVEKGDAVTDENRCAALMIVGLVALVAVISIILLFIHEKQSDAHLAFMATCVPDDAALKQVGSGEWIVLSSSCCPRMHAPWSCPFDRSAYDLIVPVGALEH